jgi:protease YdgD
MMDRQDNVLIFDCDVTYGSSGAPVFSHPNGWGRVVSVVSGMTMINGKKVALGMYLPPLIPDLKLELRSTSYTPSVTASPKVRRIGVGKTRNDTGAKFTKLSGS